MPDTSEEFRSCLAALKFVKSNDKYKHCNSELRKFEETTFQSLKRKGTEQLKSNSPKVTIEDDKTGDQPMNQAEQQDKTVPLGWRTKEKMKDGQMLEIIISPDGLTLPSRRFALCAMMRKGVPAEDLRACLVHEGWKQFSLLPQNWRFRKSRDGGHFLTNLGDVLKAQDALNFAIKSTSIPKEEVNSLQIFIEKATVGGVEFDRFLLHTSVLQVNSPKTNVPQNPGSTRISKEPIEGKTERKIDENVHKVEETTGVQSAKPLDVDPDLFSKLCPGTVLTRVARSSSHDGSKIAGSEPVSVQEVKPRHTEEELVVRDLLDDLLVEIVTKSVADEFLKKLVNLELKSYPSRLNQLKHLVEGGSSLEKIREVMNLLKTEGWHEARYLPKDWITMKNKGKALNINVISTEGHLFKSYKAAIWYMMSSEKYDENDIDHFKLFPDGNINRKIDVTKPSEEDSRTTPSQGVR